MDYQNKEIPISDLINWIDQNKIDLQPPYQRNFIWSPTDQKLLIKSIAKGYPLPNFFIFRDKNGKLEMVDGQQRAKTIYRFLKGEIKSKKTDFIYDLNPQKLLDYKLNVVEIYNLSADESLEEFYYLVNKRGVHLNPAEVNKAQYHNSVFLKLVNEVMSIDEMSNLDIFSDTYVSRMNDRSLIEELVAYLFKGITDKRNAVDELFENDLMVNEAYVEKKKLFERIIKVIDKFNDLKPINSTRYKQRNDFYTLFCFVEKHLNLDLETLKYQYQILTFIDDNEFITPKNDDCPPFQTYALNCVSQSNSKFARQSRLDFMNALLCNEDIEQNNILKVIESYLEAVFDKDEIQWKTVNNFQLIDIYQF